MTVEIVAQSTPELVEAMERLIPQLSRSAPALTAEQCEAFVAQKVARVSMPRIGRVPSAAGSSGRKTNR